MLLPKGSSTCYLYLDFKHFLLLTSWFKGQNFSVRATSTIDWTFYFV